MLTVIYQVSGVKRKRTLNHLLQRWCRNLPILQMNDAGAACSIECLVVCLEVNEVEECVCAATATLKSKVYCKYGMQADFQD